MRKKKATRRFGTRALVALLVLSLSVMMVPAVAFAGVQVTADSENKTETFGDISETTDSHALHVKAANEKDAEVTAGNVSSIGNQTTVVVTTMNGTGNGGTATVKTGDISNTGAGGGLSAAGGKNGTTSIEVNGNVSSVKQPGAMLSVGPGLAYPGDKANVNVTVSGNVTSQDNSGAFIRAGGYAPNASLDLAVEGDVSGGQYGLFVGNTSDTAKTDVLVTGTIESVGSDSLNGVAFIVRKVDANTLTTWKIKAASGNLVNDETIAKAINYIIKVNNVAMTSSSSGNLTAAGANGKTSHDYNVANEGEKVYLNVADGYKVTSATQDGIALSQEDGKYYYVVTRGGGINIQATVEAISAVYKVVFANEDGTVLQKTEEQEGAMPAYKGTTPTKAEDADYTYTWNGWTPAVAKVTKDITYMATYEKTAKDKPAPDPDDPDNPDNPDNPKPVPSQSSDMPQTGDSTPLMLIVSTLLLSAAVLVASCSKRKTVRITGKHVRR